MVYAKKVPFSANKNYRGSQEGGAQVKEQFASQTPAFIKPRKTFPGIQKARANYIGLSEFAAINILEILFALKINNAVRNFRLHVCKLHRERLLKQIHPD